MNTCGTNCLISTSKNSKKKNKLIKYFNQRILQTISPKKGFKKKKFSLKKSN